MTPRSRCPSGKHRYKDEIAAKFVLATLPDKWKRAERRAYRCPKCAGFHLTSKR